MHALTLLTHILFVGRVTVRVSDESFTRTSTLKEQKIDRPGMTIGIY